jgi:hypothetical protein
VAHEGAAARRERVRRRDVDELGVNGHTGLLRELVDGAVGW